MGRGSIMKGRYRMESEIYRGGMGVIYLCTDIHSGDHYVIKHPLYDGTNDDVKVEKLKVEANILKTLSHPNIVKYIDSFEENKVFYMVIEYINGNDLRNLFIGRATTEVQVKDFCKQLFDALEYLHNLNIIHRDIKPSNLILSGSTLKLIDFGGAKMRFTGLPQTKSVLYTPGYGAPEQQSGDSNFQSDIFAVGATMYFLLTGKDPCRMPPFSPCIDDPRVTKSLDDVVQKATNNDPNRRYQTVREMRNALFGTYAPRPAYNPRIIIGSQEYVIRKNMITLGRGDSTFSPDIVISDPEKYISRVHARMTRDAAGNYFIEDCSQNGTFVYMGGSYKRIQGKWFLQDNDIIAFCWSPTKGPYMILKFKTL